MTEEKRNQIENIGDLEASFPKLVSEIRDQVIKKIVAWPVDKIREKFPGLCQRIEKQLGVFKGPDMSVPGFLLAESDEDPFAEGALRIFMRLKKVVGLELPIVLEFKDPFTRPALESYVLRAEGGGDRRREFAAKIALRRCK